jgi:putative flippase GtrA
LRSVALAGRLRSLAHEALKFGVVGAVGFLVDVSVFNVLRYAGDPGVLEHKPLTAKAISVALATLVTYFGNRHWTWRDRPRAARHREAVLFFLFSGLGMAIALVCLAFSHYVLDLRSPLADNISANLIGMGLGTIFRFWAYKRYVFLHPEHPKATSAPLRPRPGATTTSSPQTVVAPASDNSNPSPARAGNAA